MTWSIIARDSSTGQIGIAVATKFFAVGARVPHIAAGIGGVATQALVNPYYGIDGVTLLRQGRSPQEIVAALLATDDGCERRHCRAYRQGLRRLVRASAGRRLLHRRQHARGSARAGGYGESLRGQQ